MKVLLVDNFDSFTYNLYQYLLELGASVSVVRNNETTIRDIIKNHYSHIVISPGPGEPKQAGIIISIIKELGGQIPILGVCLGHQAIGEAFGGDVIKAPRQMHGKVSEISHDKKGVFKGVKPRFKATRYHSLVVKKKSLPSCLEISAKTTDGIIMGLRHKKFRIEGVQFHPESYLTEEGKKILANFLEMKES